MNNQIYYLHYGTHPNTVPSIIVQTQDIVIKTSHALPTGSPLLQSDFMHFKLCKQILPID